MRLVTFISTVLVLFLTCAFTAKHAMAGAAIVIPTSSWQFDRVDVLHPNYGDTLGLSVWKYFTLIPTALGSQKLTLNIYTVFDPIDIDSTRPHFDGDGISFTLPPHFNPDGYPYSTYVGNFGGAEEVSQSPILLQVSEKIFLTGSADGVRCYLLTSLGPRSVQLTTGLNTLSVSNIPELQDSANSITCNYFSDYTPLPVTISEISVRILGPEPSPTPSVVPTALEFQNVEITQAVGNFQFDPQSEVYDLVLGKSTSIQSTIKLSPALPNENSQITVKATLDDGTSTSGTVSAASASSPNGTLVVLPPFIPSSTGSSNVVITATGSDGIVAADPITKKVNIHRTNPLKIGFIPIDGCTGNKTCYPAVERDLFSKIISEDSQFVSDAYPLANSISQGLSVTTISSPYFGDPEKSNYAINKDLMSLGLMAKRLGLNRLVGVVPEGYPTYHLDSFAGYAPIKYTSALLVNESSWSSVVAHELAHTFGVTEGYDRDTLEYNGPEIQNGFNVRLGSPILGAEDFMGPNRNFKPQWIGQETFSKLFTALKSPVVDPSVIVLSGILNSNGTVELGPSYKLSDGTLTRDGPGTFQIQSLDDNGQLLSTLNLDIRFDANVDPGTDATPGSRQYGEVQTMSAPFVVEIPDDGNLSTTRYNFNGKTIATFSPRAKLLSDAISSIPDTSFNRNPFHERKALFAGARAIEHRFETCQKLKTDRKGDNWFHVSCLDETVEQILSLRKRLDRSLNDSTETINPLQMTRNEVLGVVDSTILNVLGSPAIQTVGKEFRIKILPKSSRDLLRVISVTQGEHGEVTPERDGEVRYKPNSKFAQADRFTVTIGDPEGGTVTKSITILPACHDRTFIDRWISRFR